MALVGARIEIEGTVQGVGFRPFIYRLAGDMGLSGWVLNDANGVTIEVDAEPEAIGRFIDRIRTELPQVAGIDDLRTVRSDAFGHRGFSIRHSDGDGDRTAIILPDLATCPACRTDIREPGDRRHGYPFTNCTNCGPRFSIICDLPYDRPNTTMAAFSMCEPCRSEYEDPLDRRFHAQPTACPTCGPHLSWFDGEGLVPGDRAALAAAAAAIREGSIVALKGIGGYQLVVDATDPEAVSRLRARKHRPTKPLAVMVADLASALAEVELDEIEQRAMADPRAPIVLATRRDASTITEAVAPGNPSIGVMLPTTPLHELLLGEVEGPIVATSGNRTDEPICIDGAEARIRLAGIADGYLMHDRPIQRHVDDSVVRRIDGEVRMLRRARGFAPLPIALPHPIPPTVAVGAHLKNTVAVSVGRNVFVSQHIGDLATEEADRAFQRVIEDLLRMYDVQPEVIAHDAHPDYRSTIHATSLADTTGAEAVAVQHHHAHLASCLADNQHTGPALGVTWDGTGYGTDGTIWGGEFLLGDAGGYDRVAHLTTFRLPGGEAAVREPRRSAASALHAAGVDLAGGTPGLDAFTDEELHIVGSMLDRGINSPVTSSAGRLFDAVAGILGIGTVATFEGEAAIALEHAAHATDVRYDIPIVGDGRGESPATLDWRPMIRAIVADLATEPVAEIAGRFHATLAATIVDVANLIGHPTVALTGGCFQNRLLTEQTAAGLRSAGFEVLLHRRVPPNDGGISLGQVAVASARVATSSMA